MKKTFSLLLSLFLMSNPAVAQEAQKNFRPNTLFAETISEVFKAIPTLPYCTDQEKQERQANRKCIARYTLADTFDVELLLIPQENYDLPFPAHVQVMRMYSSLTGKREVESLNIGFKEQTTLESIMPHFTALYGKHELVTAEKKGQEEDIYQFSADNIRLEVFYSSKNNHIIRVRIYDVLNPSYGHFYPY